MAERRRGLGRGIGALIPDNQRESKDRPFDVFFGGGPSLKDPAQVSEEGVTSADQVEKPEQIIGAPAAQQTGATSSHEKNGVQAPAGSHSDDPTTDTLKEVTSAATQGKTGDSEVADSAPGEEPTAGDVETSTADESIAEASDAGQEDTTAESELESAIAPAAVTDRGTPSTDELVAVPGATYAELSVESIVPNQRQPRTIFDEEELDELAASIREVGVLQPVIVRPLSEPIAELPEARYELIMGERRLRASQRAGSETIPAIVRRTADEDLLRDALLENLHRAQLNPLEEAAAYQQLLEDFSCTQEELARRIARSRPQITNTLRLLKLPPLVQRRVAAGVLSAGHARALLGLADAAAMERVAQRIVAESLSVRQVEELVAMGDEPQTLPARRRRTKRYAPELGSLSGRLTDRFDTRVKVDMGVRKGTIKIDFATIEDLNRILGMMSPEVGQVELEGDGE